MLSVNEINLLQKQNEALKKQNKNLQQEVKQWKHEYEMLDACIELEQGKIADLKAENERLKEENVKLLFDKGTLVEFCNKLTQIIDEKKESENKLLQTLQEIKTIAGKPKPFKDFSEIKTATEVEYDYAAICNELELRLHKVLELITKAEE